MILAIQMVFFVGFAAGFAVAATMAVRDCKPLRDNDGKTDNYGLMVRERKDMWTAGWWDERFSPSCASGDLGFTADTPEGAVRKLLRYVLLDNDGGEGGPASGRTSQPLGLADDDSDYCNCHPDTQAESMDDPNECGNCGSRFRTNAQREVRT